MFPIGTKAKITSVDHLAEHLHGEPMPTHLIGQVFPVVRHEQDRHDLGDNVRWLFPAAHLTAA